MTTKTTTIRLDESDKKEANQILNELGLNFNQAMNMFVKQLIHQRGLPFDVKIPNKETVDAMSENLNGAKRYDSAESIIGDLRR